MAASIVDGIDMSEVKADELKKMIKAFNDSKLGTIKTGANPLGSAKAFVKAIEGLSESKQSKLSPELADYYNRIVRTEDELKGPAGGEEEDEPSIVAKKDPVEPTKVVATPTGKKSPKIPKPKAVRTIAEQHGVEKKTGKGTFECDPNKPTKKSIVIAMVSKSKGATLDEMGQAMTDAGLGDFERNKTTAGLWLRKLGFGVTINAKTGKITKAE